MMQLFRLFVLTVMAGFATAFSNCTLSNAEPLGEPALQNLKNYNSAMERLVLDTKAEVQESMGKGSHHSKRLVANHMICMLSTLPFAAPFRAAKLWKGSFVLT